MLWMDWMGDVGNVCMINMRWFIGRGGCVSFIDLYVIMDDVCKSCVRLMMGWFNS